MGGSERFALRLAVHAAGTGGYAPRVVCPPLSELANRSRAAGIEVIGADFPDLAPRPIGRQLRAVVALRRLISAAGEEAIFVANTSRAQAYVTAAATALHRPPAIVHIAHEQDAARRLIIRMALPRRGAVVAVGANATAAYRSALPSVEVDQINNFLTRSEVIRLRDARRSVHDGVVIGLITRMIRDKGVLELIDELAALGDNWSALWVAAAPEDPAYEAEVRARLRALGLDGRVKLMGHLTDVRELLEGVDVVVVPSTGSEGQPSVILESLAAGAAVVVRSPVYSPDFDELPVLSYTDASDLGLALDLAVGAVVASTSALLERFGPDQALAAVALAAKRARAR